ncbi:phosphotransferase family protein [Nocardioides zhouii]|uniref:Aminoglycoside phosphotransferase family protein n=1 Tax=Nocardioides zhouii TaxID=1168729 RepID=A0A4Q2SZA4_9ACTN|nr:aminoglycoside phosphotransferase family protein [Nocardioides zhouii]RYC10861.1 aminoglycoside phosphotransferase family protein [Nocardioides zhouii]
MIGPDGALTPLAGGHSGRTFLSEVAGERTVLRIYPPGDARGADAPQVDEAVLHLVRGLLPVPEVLEVRRGEVESGQPGILVTSWMPGKPADRVVDGLDDAGLARLGAAMGAAAAILAGMAMLRPGLFVDADLRLGAFPVDGLPEWVEERLAHWAPEERAALVAVAEGAQDLLDTVGRACLVHSDLNPKNVLVDPGTLQLTAILDWEFAHAGHPWTDVGNLVRFERHPAYVEAVLRAWTDLRGGSVETLLEGARAADLWALVDLATRAGANPVVDHADVLLRTVAAEGDLHAWPAHW